MREYRQEGHGSALRCSERSNRKPNDEKRRSKNVKREASYEKAQRLVFFVYIYTLMLLKP